MAGILAISVTRKDYKGKSVAKGRSIPHMIEEAMRTSLRPIESSVKQQLPGRRLKSHTRLYINRTPQGASARLVIGEGLPFSNIHAKWSDSPTIIRPKHGEYLAIPISSVRNRAEKLQGTPNRPISLWDYHPTLKRGGGRNAHVLFWKTQKGGTPFFHLKQQVSVRPSVNLQEVSSEMRMTISNALRSAFSGYDFGYTQIRKV